MTVHRPQAKAEDGTLSRTKFRFLDDSHIPTTPRSFDPRRVGIWEKGETMRKQMSHEGQRARQRGPGCVLGGGGGQAFQCCGRKGGVPLGAVAKKGERLLNGGW